MGTKNKPGAYDCIANAHPDEPMFTLLGRDPHAPILVAMWAAIREHEGEEPAKVREAVDCAIEMTKWCKKDLFVPSPAEVKKIYARALEMYHGAIDDRVKEGKERSQVERTE